MTPLARTPVLVVGAGLMGSGIAQVAAQAGHRVALLDARDGAAAAARAQIAAGFDTLVGKGRLAANAAAEALARITPLSAPGEAAALGVGVVVEAIVEDLGAKRALFAELARLLGDAVVLATNTSSISVTAIAAGLPRPGRVVGMHFFNPVPRMPLVEVVAGLQTEPAVAAAVFDLARDWGKVPVHAKSTPGFIVNRIARPYYAEALALLQEQAATPQVLDACLRGAGFRMGPCELMDLIGHDTNFAVTRSVFDAHFQDRRYGPSPLQQEMVAGGLLGRKSGHGFYAYPAGAPALPPPDPTRAVAAVAAARAVTVHGAGALADTLNVRATAALAPQGRAPARQAASRWTGLEVDGAHLMLTTGLTAAEMVLETAIPEVAVFDRPLAWTPGMPLAFSLPTVGGDAWGERAAGWLQALGFAPQRVADVPGLVVARTVAMLINEAADAVLQGVCDGPAADAAMKLGVNWPAGPFEWLAGWDADGVLGVLQALDGQYRGERYRASPWLQRRAWHDAALAGPGA